MSTSSNDFFKTKVLGHPAGLFVLFFTEMWERFSFYGMRVLLINFLTMAAIGYNPGWEWSAANAGALFGSYAGLLYLTPILGGLIADKWTGYRWAVVIGSIIMTLGHASMAMETEASLYIGLALLVIGTGFFKPTMTSIVSEMYKDLPEKKDGAYTIFYMGVNAGAFFGMMLCGYLAERVGWSWGFGLAGIFMMLGTLQFWMASPLFGDIGAAPTGDHEVELPQNVNEKSVDINADGTDKRNPFTLIDKILIAIVAPIGLLYLINDPMSKIAGIDIFGALNVMDTVDGESIVTWAGQNTAILGGLVLFLFLVISRILRYDRIVRDRMIAFVIFAFFTVFFWMSFEQGATSLVVFARDFVDRELEGGAATMYNVVNVLLTIIPLGFVTYVLYLLWRETFKRIPGSNIVLCICFLGVWGIAVWMLNRDFNTVAYDASYSALQLDAVMDEETGNQKVDKDGELVFNYMAVTENMTTDSTDKVVVRTTRVADQAELKVGEEIFIINKNKEGTKFGYLTTERLAIAREGYKEEIAKNPSKNNDGLGVVKAKVTEVKDNFVEITVSWFSILNSFFIIVFATMFSSFWDKNSNITAATKYALGLIIMAIGFGLLAYGAYGVQAGMKVSMVWLILAYLFHTLGELCLSPVGLSYVSKLVPGRMIAFMFGMWYLAIAIGNKLAGTLGGQIENITEAYSLSTFFLIFTIVPILAGVLIMVLNPLLKKLMHGVT
jgi:POT family proton-dependent oligopeptide transporter